MPTRRPRPPRLHCDPLEARDCPAIAVQFDYRYDTTGYYTPARRALLERAGATIGDQFTDQFTAITPGGGNTWTATFGDGRAPENAPVELRVPDLAVPANTVVVFAFASDVTSASTLAFASLANGFQDLNGDAGFTTAVQTRGQSGILGANGERLPNDQQTDTALWGGTVTFNSKQTFNEDLAVADRSQSRQSDFFDTAVHELGHVFGHVTSAAFYRYVSQPTGSPPARVFNGPASVARFGRPVPVATGVSSGSDGHYVDGTLDKDGRFNGLNVGDDSYTYRNLTSRLDIATFRDMGWQPATDADGTLGTATATNFTVGGPGYQKTDTIDIGIDADLYRFTAGAGSTVTVRTLRPAGAAAADTFLRVFDAAGNQLAADDNSGADPGYSRLLFTAPAAGDYFVGVSGAPNTVYVPADAEPFQRAIAGGTGGYTLQIGEVVGTPPPPPVTPTAPTAAASAPAVDASFLGTTKYDFTVTYTATTPGAAVAANSLAAGNVTVTGPGGGVLPATLVGVAPASGNAGTLTATYRFTPPGGTWDAADNGTYTLSLGADQVRDTAGAAAAPGTLAAPTATLPSAGADAARPTAAVTTAPNVSGPVADRQADYLFTVTYTDDVAVNAETLGNGNVRVTGPNGFSVLATFVSASPARNGPVRAALYTINPPDGAFAAKDNGTYTVAVEAGQVRDVAGNAVAAGAVGSFAVAVSNPPAPALTGQPQFAVGTDAGTAGTVFVYNPDKSLRATLTPFPGFTGGVRTAAADFNGDGVIDVVAATGPGVPGQVVVVSGADGKTVLFATTPFEAGFTGGLFVAAGDLTGDGQPELVVTPDSGGGPRVRVYGGARNFAPIADFFGIDDPNFRGGARVAIGDVDGNTVADLLVAAGFGGGPRVAGFDGSSLATGTPVKLFGDFFAFEPALRNGVYLAAGDVNGDGVADVVAGGGPGGGPRVTAFDGNALTASGGATLTPVANFFSGDPATRGGVRVAVKNLDGDARADLVVGSGAGAGSRVTAYLGKSVAANGTPAEQFAFDALGGFGGGVFVG